MTSDPLAATILLLFLSTAVERTVEVVLSVLVPSLRSGQALREPQDERAGPALRRVVAVALSLAAGAGFAFGLGLDLVSPLLGDAALTAAQGRAATALALAGGAAPAHELIRLVEEAEQRGKAGGQRGVGGS